MHNVGDALVRAGFLEPVMDVEMLTVHYRDFDSVVRDLRAVAATNHSADRMRGLMTPRRRRMLLDSIDALRNAEQRIPVSLELVTGQAWTGEPARGVRMEDGVASFPVSRLTNGDPPFRG